MIRRSPAGRPPPGGALRPNIALLGDDVILWSAEQRRVLWAEGREVHATGEGSLTAVDQLALGAAARWGRVANAGADFGTIQPLASDTGVTMLVIAAPSASANRKAIFSQRLGAGSVATYTLYANTTGTVGAASGQMTLYCRNTGSAGCPVTVTSAGIDGDPHCWVFANSTAASSGYALRDGADLTVTTNTALTGTFVTAAQTVRVGNPASYSTDGALAMDEPVYLVLAWPRYIPREEMRELSRLLFSEPSLAYEQVAVEAMAGASGGANFEATGAGGLQLGGSASVTYTGDYAFGAAGGLTLSGAAVASFTGDFQAAGAGGLVLGGAAAASVESGYEVSGSGGLQLGGVAAATYTADFVTAGAGGLSLAGAAGATFTGDFAAAGTGGLVLGGAAATEVDSGYSFTASGGLVLGGAAAAEAAPAYTFAASGGLTIGGEAFSDIGSAHYLASGTGGLVISGSAQYLPDSQALQLLQAARSGGGGRPAANRRLEAMRALDRRERDNQIIQTIIAMVVSGALDEMLVE